MAALAVCVLVLTGAVMLAWLGSPRTITLEITAPVGKTVVCHLVVDGKPKSREDVAPVTYQFEAKELRYAVICRDPLPPGEVNVRVHDRAGTGGSVSGAGVTGRYYSGWRGTSFQTGAMTGTHVKTMRAAVVEADAGNRPAARAYPKTHQSTSEDDDQRPPVE
ncbi:MAG: hypothetical protein AB7I48_25250 [Planctomycetaceae bacterium]